MEITWNGIKEVFYAIGSIAGVLALSKPLIESKFQRDATRVEHIKSLLTEQDLIDLPQYVYNSRRIEDSRLRPFDQLEHERRTNQDVVRFTGPLAKHYSRELDGILSAYAKFREYVQVPEWEPHRDAAEGGTPHFEWRFNKAAFEDHQGIARDYAKHLYEATEQAERMKRALQRFQLVAELHLYEAPLAGWLLDRRFAHHKLTESK